MTLGSPAYQPLSCEQSPADVVRGGTASRSGLVMPTTQQEQRGPAVAGLATLRATGVRRLAMVGRFAAPMLRHDVTEKVVLPHVDQ